MPTWLKPVDTFRVRGNGAMKIGDLITFVWGVTGDVETGEVYVLPDKLGLFEIELPSDGGRLLLDLRDENIEWVYGTLEEEAVQAFVARVLIGRGT